MPRENFWAKCLPLMLTLLLFPARAPFCRDQEIVMGRNIDQPWPDLLALDGLSMQDGKWNSMDVVLKDDEYSADERTDLLLHFNSLPFSDGAGNYKIRSDSPTCSRNTFLLGRGSAAFLGKRNALSLEPGAGSQFRTAWQDFSLEFWLYPATLNNGEIVLAWSGVRMENGGVSVQSLECRLLDRRIIWSFDNFFGSKQHPRFSISGITPLLPREWHHHLLRFDSSSGMLEYLVDGVPEGIFYATDTLREGGTILIPSTGTEGSFILGKDFTGLMDELRISKYFLTDPILERYANRSGVATSRIFDLEYSGSRLKRIDAVYESPSNSEVYFYYRVSDRLEKNLELDSPWVQFKPNNDLPGSVKGRYIQLQIELMPDGTSMLSPRLSEIRIRYEPDLPPPPPAFLMAEAGNQQVALSWRRVSEKDIGGYLIYYGNAPGQYMGTGCREGNSPIDVGDKNSLTLTGLENGKLYYFAVVAYDSSVPPHQSDFSREVSARPSRILP